MRLLILIISLISFGAEVCNPSSPFVRAEEHQSKTFSRDARSVSVASRYPKFKVLKRNKLSIPVRLLPEISVVHSSLLFGFFFLKHYPDGKQAIFLTNKQILPSLPRKTPERPPSI